MDKATLKNISTMIAIIGSIGSGIFFAVTFFAHADDLKKTDEYNKMTRMQVSLNTRNIQIQSQATLRDHLWGEKLILKKQLRKSPDDVELKHEYEKVVEKLKEIKIELKKLRK